MWFWLSETVQQPDTRPLTIIFLKFLARKPVWNPWLEQAVSFPAWYWNIIHVRITFPSLPEKFTENWFASIKPAIAICLVWRSPILSFSCMKRLSNNFIQEWREIQTKGNLAAAPGCKPMIINAPGVSNRMGLRERGSGTQHCSPYGLLSYHEVTGTDNLDCPSKYFNNSDGITLWQSLDIKVLHKELHVWHMYIRNVYKKYILLLAPSIIPLLVLISFLSPLYIFANTLKFIRMTCQFNVQSFCPVWNPLNYGI